MRSDIRATSVYSPVKVQQGFATLTLTVLMLAVIILVTLYTARFKAQEQRIMRNHLASHEAFVIADAGLERVIMRLDADRTNVNRTITGVIGAGVYTATLTGQRISDTLRGDVDIVDVDLVAQSADGRGRKNIGMKLAVIPLMRRAPAVPVAVRGNMNVSGSFQIVANPNGGGDGVPLSIWTSGNVDINGNGTTCGQEEFSNGNCSSQPFSERGDHGMDILDNDTNFPADLLDYVFGVPEASWEDLRELADIQVTDCTGLGPASKGFIWVTGSCSMGAGDVIGSEEEPVILVMQDAHLTMNGGATIFGMVFSFTTPGNATQYSLQMNGGSLVHGSVLANRNPDLSNGNLTVRYAESVLTNMINKGTFRRVHRVGGSWHDF
ncbi:pilus assembly PilX N-terminal domain-containing protein [Pseudidiomarina sp.]|uniref:pilus assembly PilX N-terminal domain-containing protein n=1 Tax=Pseudidiomarina sp. TaxID=2081707 RepID=UPI00299CDEA4|nr:pilus assembly PilX N-terminal domain-containing protein [Pseudidiomarina sp.]MDX1706669.1 pilus assembly PilX N-terminal domain-containing protein [Pseudidiomarina sp.]